MVLLKAFTMYNEWARYEQGQWFELQKKQKVNTEFNIFKSLANVLNLEVHARLL